MPEEATSTTPAAGTLMQGRRGLIMGVANHRSIAWAIAQACAAQGAELAFTFQGEALEKRVRPLAASIGSDFLLACDVSSDEQMDVVFAALEHRWGKIDFLVHAIGFANKEYLRGRYLDTPRDAFLQAMDISCFSFVATGRRAAAIMNPGGSLLTLSYLGAETWIPHYNVMGVAKAALEASVRYIAADLAPRRIHAHAISAGPVKTRAASGIGRFDELLDRTRDRTPAHRLVSIEEIGAMAAFLASDAGMPMTGSVTFADHGAHTIA